MAVHSIRVHAVRFEEDVAVVVGVDLHSGAPVAFHADPRTGEAIWQAVAAASSDRDLPTAEVEGSLLAGA